MSEIEHLIRTTAPNRHGGEPVVHLYTLAEVIRGAYSWGRVDGKTVAEGRELYGVGEEYTVVSVPLDDLRATFEPREPSTDGR